MFWSSSRHTTLPGGDAPHQHGDEARLVARAQRRDSAAFGELYERHLARVYRYIACRTARQDVAEDLTSEVFLNAWKSIERFEDRGHTFRSWLLRLAHNEVVDYYRTRKRDTSLPEHDAHMLALAGPELLAETKADRASLLGAVHRLPDEWQQLILLRFVEDFSFEEIGTVLGKHSGACRQIQHRALARLRELLAAEEASHGI
jgi:RNA polymerase sigma-70 factor (ECF subfamily)